MKKVLILLVTLVTLPATVLADPPTYAGNWQWNGNVKINFIYSYWDNLPTQVSLDNGEYCHINAADKELLATVLAMRAQGTSGQVVCEEASTSTIDGKPTRRLHRIKY